MTASWGTARWGTRWASGALLGVGGGGWCEPALGARAPGDQAGWSRLVRAPHTCNVRRCFLGGRTLGMMREMSLRNDLPVVTCGEGGPHSGGQAGTIPG